MRLNSRANILHRLGFQSTHPLRGATLTSPYSFLTCSTFQSTHPLRGATADAPRVAALIRNFNPRTPCGVRLYNTSERANVASISIHAPLAGCDKNLKTDQMYAEISIHAPLAGCDAGGRQVCYLPRRISIHAPLAGCDTLADKLTEPSGPDFNPRTPCGVRLLLMGIRKIWIYFNPRTPCGVRLLPSCFSGWLLTFQSTHPLRGATP